MTLRIIPNPDQKYFEEITKKVLDNDGYCPCMMHKDETTKCMCKEFREQNFPGFCHCGRFQKVEVKE